MAMSESPTNAESGEQKFYVCPLCDDIPPHYRWRDVCKHMMAEHFEECTVLASEVELDG